jgi:Na+/glutamate symporter
MADTWSGRERRSDTQDGERIAVLESNMQSLMAGQKTIMERLDSLSNDLTKYRGFVAGVIWIVGGFGAALIAAWQFLKDHIK